MQYRSRYRSRNTIVKQLLTALQEPQKRTALMYIGRLSYAQLNEYTKFLLSKKYMEYNQNTKLCSITVEGRKVLSALNNVPVI